MRKYIFVIFLVVMVAVASDALAQPAPGWSMYHNGISGRGYTNIPSTLAGGGPVYPLWVRNAGGVWGSPIEDVANGAVVVATNAVPELYVLNQFTGANMFGAPLPLSGGWSDGTGVIDSLTKNYIVGSQGGAGAMDWFNTAGGYPLVFTDPASGGLSTKLNTWEYTVYSVANPPGGPGPGIYTWSTAGSTPPALLTLLPSVDVWHGFVAMSPDATTLYYKDMGLGGNEDSVLYSVNALTGAINWATPPHGEGWGNIPSLVDSQGNIYQGFQDVDFDPDGVPNTGDEYVASTLEKYSAAGVLLWQAEFNGGAAWWHGGYALDPAEQFIYTQTRGGPPGAAKPMGGITCFDTATGTWQWSVYTQATGGNIGDGFGAPVVDGAGVIYAVDHNGTFFGISPAGTVMFARDGFHTSSWASPMISQQGIVYTTGDGGNIVAWQPIPEPATMILIGLGLLGILSRIRRKK